jgi:rhodanese-related sulfurtransferase
MPIKQLTVLELQEKRTRQEKFLLLDVREAYEYQYAHIADSILMPLKQIPQRMAKLDSEQEIVLLCHHGMRSQQAAVFLEQNGFTNLANLLGGIDAWSCQCDNSVARY